MYLALYVEKISEPYFIGYSGRPVRNRKGSTNHSDRKLNRTINTRIVRRPMVKHLKLDILLFSVNPENICHQALIGGTAFLLLGIRLDAKSS